MALVDYALKYVADGKPVIPLCWPDWNGTCSCGKNHEGKNIGKVPLTEHGLTDAALSATKAKEYWAQYPKANIGIVIPPGYFVLDVDAGHNGFASLEKIQNDHDFELTPTLLITTGSGGHHYWYKTEKDIRNTTRLAGYDGLDIRGIGGYVVAPPSLHRSGHYYEVSPVWDGEITMAPVNLVRLSLTRPQAPSTGEAGQRITEGSRNDTLVRDAGAMRRRGLSEKAIYAALEVINNEQCCPPLPNNEVLLIAKSISRYAPQQPTKRMGVRFD